jgi:hypothetical protein
MTMTDWVRAAAAKGGTQPPAAAADADEAAEPAAPQALLDALDAAKVALDPDDQAVAEWLGGAADQVAAVIVSWVQDAAKGGTGAQ